MSDNVISESPMCVSIVSFPLGFGHLILFLGFPCQLKWMMNIVLNNIEALDKVNFFQMGFNFLLAHIPFRQITLMLSRLNYF